jgi:hypothetical protein
MDGIRGKIRGRDIAMVITMAIPRRRDLVTDPHLTIGLDMDRTMDRTMDMVTGMVSDMVTDTVTDKDIPPSLSGEECLMDMITPRSLVTLREDKLTMNPVTGYIAMQSLVWDGRCMGVTVTGATETTTGGVTVVEWRALETRAKRGVTVKEPRDKRVTIRGVRDRRGRGKRVTVTEVTEPVPTRITLKLTTAS